MRNELLDKDESEAFSRYLQRRGNRVHRPRLVTSSFSIQVEISLCVTITSGRLTNDRKIRFICAACLLFKTEENMNTPRSEDAYAFPGSRCFWEPITNCDQFRALVSLLAIPNMKSFGKRSGLRCTAWLGGLCRHIVEAGKIGIVRHFLPMNQVASPIDYHRGLGIGNWHTNATIAKAI